MFDVTPIESVEDLMEMAWAFRSSRVLQLAHKLDVFTILDRGFKTSSEVASECESDPDMTERLLIACSALGLLKIRDKKYGNTDISSKYLVRDSALYQGGWIDHVAEDLWGYWGKGIEDEIGGRLKFEKNEGRRFTLAMHGLAVSGEAEELAKAIDLRGRKLLYDIGGGPGTFSIFLCKMYPELRAVVFDLPEAVETAKEIISKYGMSDRIKTIAGDWGKEDFGLENDVVLMSNILHGRGSEAEMKLKKAYKSLKSGGLLIIRDFLLYDDKSGPVSAALFNLMVGAYTLAELIGLLKSAGFVDPREMDIPHKTHSIIVVKKP
jgi:SAM-dependent methyltransferase